MRVPLCLETPSTTKVRFSQPTPERQPGVAESTIAATKDKEASLMTADHQGLFEEDGGIFVSRRSVQHHDEDYDQRSFDVLIKMQRHHFWYRGRHRFLLKAVHRELGSRPYGARQGGISAIDMGGGCGGWMEYLHRHSPGLFTELAIGDSSLRALSLAEPVVGSFAVRYQIDVLDLRWEGRWDVAFLLDVIEHIPDDVEAVRQVCNCLRPGGLLFVTVPALQFFWTYNDDLVKHLRRYSRRDFEALAQAVGMELLRADYFMFFLSPVLYLARHLARPARLRSPREVQRHLARSHRTPPKAFNEILQGILFLEAAISNYIRFPWGTSLLGVFRSRSTFPEVAPNRPSHPLP